MIQVHKKDIGGLKTQQDFVNVWSNEEINGYIVCDGHGSKGHDVAEFVVNLFSIFMSRHSQMIKLDPIQYLNIFFNEAETKLRLFLQRRHYNFDIDFAGGTTCTIILIIENKIYCANVGDSEAWLFSSESICLTEDHSAGNMNEIKRMMFFPEPVQLTMPDQRTSAIQITSDGFKLKESSPKNARGDLAYYVRQADNCLSMTRSLGDYLFKDHGVIAVPSIKVYEKPSNGCVIMASDGLWDCVTIQELRDLILESNTERMNWIRENTELHGDILLQNFLIRASFLFNQNNDNISFILVYF